MTIRVVSYSTVLLVVVEMIKNDDVDSILVGGILNCYLCDYECYDL